MTWLVLVCDFTRWYCLWSVSLVRSSCGKTNTEALGGPAASGLLHGGLSGPDEGPYHVRVFHPVDTVPVPQVRVSLLVIIAGVRGLPGVGRGSCIDYGRVKVYVRSVLLWPRTTLETGVPPFRWRHQSYTQHRESMALFILNNNSSQTWREDSQEGTLIAAMSRISCTCVFRTQLQGGKTADRS